MAARISETLIVASALLIAACGGGATSAPEAPEAPQGRAGCVAEAAESPEQKVDCLLQLTDMTDVFESMGLEEGMAAKFEERKEELPEGFFDEVLEVTHTAFAPDAMQAEFRGRLVEGQEPKHMDELLRWYATPLGQRYGGIGRENPTGEEVGAWLEETPPPRERMKKVAGLAVAAGLPALIEVIVVVPSKLMLQTMAKAAGGAQKVPSDAEVGAMLEPAVTESAKQAILLLAYGLRDFSDREIAELTAFEQEPGSVWFHSAVIDAMSQSLSSAYGKLAQAFAKAIGEARAASKQG